MKTLLALLVSLLLVACAKEEEKNPRTIYFHPVTGSEVAYDPSTMTEEELAQLDPIRERLNAFVGRPGFFTFVPVDHLEAPPGRRYPTGDVGGTHDHETGEIAVYLEGVETCMEETPRQSPSFEACFQAIMLHELCHSMGMDHTKAAGIMAVPLSTFDFTDADRTECQSREFCKDPELMHPLEEGE